MVSPCVSSRRNVVHGNVGFMKGNQRGGIVKKASPSEFQFSSSDVNVCGHPKQSRSRGKNGLASDARKLGSVRVSGLLNAGSENIVFVSNKSKSSSSENSSTSTSSKKRRKKPLTQSTDVQPTRNINEHLHFAAREETDRRKQMASTLNKFLGNSESRGRKNALIHSFPSFHQESAPDARRDPYNVHKWRRKSGRMKFAGMESSPILSERLKREDDVRKAASFDANNGLSTEQRVHAYSEYLKKPRVPLPGVNMLPAMHVHTQSETTGGEELTLRFARNAAMEELERRFHDGGWKMRRSNKQKLAPTDSNMTSQTGHQRPGLYRRAASLLPLVNRDRQNYFQDEPGTMSRVDTLSESPDKSVLLAEAIDEVSQRRSSKGELTEQGSPVKRVCIETDLGKHGDNNDGANFHPKNSEIISDSMKFKIVESSLSEETVTIVTKPSISAMPAAKLMDSGSYEVFNHSVLGKETSGTAVNLSENVRKPNDNTTLRLQINEERTMKKYPVLPNFSKSRYKEPLEDEASVLFSQLQRTMHKQNEQQYKKFSRSSHDSSEQDSRRLAKTRSRKVTLPPLGPIENLVNSKEIGNKRKNRLGRTVNVKEENSLSPLESSPTNKKSLSSKNSPLSRASNSSFYAKESITPVDSLLSQNTTGGRRKSKKWRRMSRVEGKGSPHFLKAARETRSIKLKGKWRAIIRVVIVSNRLCRDHHIISDDSYNIHFVTSGNRISEIDTKPEVLFDVTDYKMKNQQKLSDTTRRILNIPSKDRTDREIQMVQTTLRNIKAVSDHSAPVQKKLAEYGYVMGIDSKRVVVLEDRRPLNFYILLTGSAVVIKKDEKGNTNPISFIKRGDIFGENEILNNGNWNWSVVTVDPCEFLLLDRQDYVKIFLAGGSGGLLNDPDRGTFLKNLSLFKGWPISVLESNPNRCMFRYFKRGALLARNDMESEWIIVVKSGSCSVLKPMKVETFSNKDIFWKLLDEQRAKFSASQQTQLVERIEKSTKEEHMAILEEMAEVIRTERAAAATSYQQIEIAALLKELNIELQDQPLTPVNEVDEDQYTSPIDSNEKTQPVPVTDGNIESSSIEFRGTKIADPVTTKEENIESPGSEFRVSRISDRGIPPRTPSPMKAAYLQTGITTNKMSDSENTLLEEGNLRRPVQRDRTSPQPKPLVNKKFDKFKMTDESTEPIDTLSVNDFLSKLDASSVRDELTPADCLEKLEPVYINVRKLTKGNSFGLDSILFNDQPSLALVSNGAECLLLNKKFYLDNMTDEVLKRLREVEYPYPSEVDLMESYWRLISWWAFKQRTLRGVLKRRTKVKQYASPRKTDVY